MIVSARTHAHYPPRRKERELVRLRRFSFLRDLIVFWLWLTPLAWLVAARYPSAPTSILALHFDRANIFSLKQSTRSRPQAGQHGFNAYSLYFRADDLQSPAAMPEPMLVPESPEDPLGGVALLPGTPEVVYQDLVDDAGEGLQLRTPGRSLPPVARRR